MNSIPQNILFVDQQAVIPSADPWDVFHTAGQVLLPCLLHRPWRLGDGSSKEYQRHLGDYSSLQPQYFFWIQLRFPRAIRKSLHSIRLECVYFVNFCWGKGSNSLLFLGSDCWTHSKSGDAHNSIWSADQVQCFTCFPGKTNFSRWWTIAHLGSYRFLGGSVLFD